MIGRRHCRRGAQCIGTAGTAKAHGWLHATLDQCENLQRALCDAKTAALARVAADHMLTIRHYDLLADPASQVDRIIEFLTLQVRAEQRQAALEMAQPARRHI